MDPRLSFLLEKKTSIVTYKVIRSITDAGGDSSTGPSRPPVASQQLGARHGWVAHREVREGGAAGKNAATRGFHKTPPAAVLLFKATEGKESGRNGFVLE